MKGRRNKGKNPRDPRTWSNRQIEQDSEGYVAAQQAYRDDQEAAEQQRRAAVRHSNVGWGVTTTTLNGTN